MRIALVCLLLTGLLNNVSGQSAQDKSYDLIVGTYTNKDKSNGLHVYSFNSKTGDLAYRSKNTSITNSSYLAVSSDNKNVYSVNEVGNGQISAFSFDKDSGELTFLNSASAGGSGPCYVSVDNKKQVVFAGNYSSGSLAAIRVEKDGLLNEDIQVIQHTGSSVDKVNQSKPHVHSVVLSPDQRYLFTADLGTDKVNTYRFDPKASRPLEPAAVPFTTIKAGSGPRHLTFHPNGKYAYVIMELSAEIAALDYKEGKLTVKQYITMLPGGFKGGVEAADIHISPDGKFLYGSNRSDANDIVIYSITKDGKLNYAGRQSALVNTPRNFVIDPSGNFLLVANMEGNNVVVFKRDRNTGLLTPADKQIQVDGPACLKFIAVN